MDLAPVAVTTTTRLRTWGRALLDLIFPPRCVDCGNPEAFELEPQVCSGCRGAWSTSEYTPCFRCGARVFSHPILIGCKLCHGQSFRFSQAFALGNYESALRSAVYRIKRRNHEPLAFHMGRCLGQTVREAVPGAEIDVVVPMPTHWVRFWQRGGNPAEQLAVGLARELQRPMIPDLLGYVRATKKQGRLSRAQRLENVHRAIAVRAHYRFGGLRILLVDDVMASGATANEASRALLQSGAGEVWVAVAARGTALKT